MKKTKFIIIIFLIFHNNIVLSQNVPYDFESALKYSSNYTFGGNSYIPDKPKINNLESYNVYAVQQSRYDNGYYFITNESSKLFHLQLINKYNKEYLKLYIDKLRPILASQFNNLDWSKSEYISYGYNIIARYINTPYKMNGVISNPIVDEIKLLQKINAEYFRLKNNNPDGFYSSKRWSDIKNLLIELENCEISNIPYLGQKYNIY
ncbi:hypothetical protein MCEGE10_01817 [Flavobacteriaceae bacterium]